VDAATAEKYCGGRSKKLKERGYSHMYLETAAALKQAVKLYKSFGFRPVDLTQSKCCDQGFVF
jgi:hypothetical protein